MTIADTSTDTSTDTPTDISGSTASGTAAPTPPARRQPRRARWLRRSALVAATVVALAVVGWFGVGLIQPHPYSGTVLQAPTAAPSLDGLVDSEGAPVDLGAFRGDLVLVYFGYTHCPDVCPTTLSQVDRALDRLGDDAARVEVLLISVDPARDDPVLLGEYARSFDPSFIGATGPIDDVERIASTYGVYFAAQDAGDDDYDVDHSATLMGIDPDGHLRIVWPALLDVDALAADIRELL